MAERPELDISSGQQCGELIGTSKVEYPLSTSSAMASIAVDDHRYENVLMITSKHPSLLGVAAPGPSGLLVGGEPGGGEDAIEEELGLHRVSPGRQGLTAVPDTG